MVARIRADPAKKTLSLGYTTACSFYACTSSRFMPRPGLYTRVITPSRSEYLRTTCRRNLHDVNVQGVMKVAAAKLVESAANPSPHKPYAVDLFHLAIRAEVLLGPLRRPGVLQQSSRKFRSPLHASNGQILLITTVLRGCIYGQVIEDVNEEGEGKLSCLCDKDKSRLSVKRALDLPRAGMISRDVSRGSRARIPHPVSAPTFFEMCLQGGCRVHAGHFSSGPSESQGFIQRAIVSRSRSSLGSITLRTFISLR